MYISIKLQNGSSIDKEISKPEIIIGRSPLCDLPVPEEALSRQHAKITNLGDQIYITDLGSSNGVFIDGQKIQPHVQVPFNTFLQLMLGPLECSIYLNSGETKPTLKIAPRPFEETDEDQRTKVITRPISPQVKDYKFNPILTPGKKKERAMNPKFLGLLLVLGIGMIAYYQIDEDKNSNDAKVTKNSQKAKENSPSIKSAPDKFLSDGLYLEKLKTKSLETDKTITKDVQLELPSEGVAIEENEVFIFMEPKRLLENSRFDAIRETSGAADLLALYQILKSNLLYDLQRGKYSQIHLLITTTDSKVKKIYRFHSEKFSKDPSLKVALLNKAADAILKKEIEQYLEVISPSIPVKQVEISLTY
jgi:hypothetical protein